METTRDEAGFTLVEMIVTMTVLSVLMLSLSQFYTTFVRSAQKSRAYSSVDENLTLVLDKMSESIKSAARVSRVPGRQPFEFVGFDGDGKFESSDTSPHGMLGDSPNELSDRLHFHGLESRRFQKTGSPEKVSGRIYYAFWINGENSTVTKNDLDNSWGILMRKRYHTGKDTIPHYPSSSLTDPQSPVLNLKGDPSLTLDGVPEGQLNLVLGRYIDYLSFQYYDPETGDWKNEWNTLDSTEFPSDSRFPSAVRIAIRGYDYRADNSGGSSDRLADPQWYKTTVSLSGSE